jgi:hypothetical protein
LSTSATDGGKTEKNSSEQRKTDSGTASLASRTGHQSDEYEGRHFSRVPMLPPFVNPATGSEAPKQTASPEHQSDEYGKLKVEVHGSRAGWAQWTDYRNANLQSE